MDKIKVKETEITIIKVAEKDYISLTDMANAKTGKSRAADIIKNWLRNRYTLEFLGTWELINNQDFKVVEFDHFNLKGNIRDYASINELICLSNMENLNAVFINENMPQDQRLIKLNQIAIQQMSLLQEVENRELLK